MKVKVSEASGAVLDWMVAKCEGDRVFRLRIARPSNWAGVETEPDRWEPRAQVADVGWFADYRYSPSTDWAQGGAIIERQEIELGISVGGGWFACMNNDIDTLAMLHYANAPTPLIAAMRCHVKSQFGEEVEVPDDLRT